MLHRGLSPTTPTDAPISSHGAILSSPTPPLRLPTVPFPARPSAGSALPLPAWGIPTPLSRCSSDITCSVSPRCPPRPPAAPWLCICLSASSQ